MSTYMKVYQTFKSGSVCRVFVLLCTSSELAGLEDNILMYLLVRDFSYVY